MNRIQRTRLKGSKLPPNTLVVTRGTKWGNPFKQIHNDEESRQTVVNRFREYLQEKWQERLIKLFLYECKIKDIEHLACWCKPDEKCHADVWIEIWDSAVRDE